jgi:pimeloyl-ACP methyl ester carboxylesterase
MSHLVFLVHGMGVHNGAWSTPYVDAIEGAYDQYESLSSTPLKDRFQFVEITYDDIFQEIVTQWSDNATLISAAAAEVGAPVSKLTDWLKGASKIDGNFQWTHAADVLLYRCFSLVRERVCVHVATQLVKAIDQQIKEDGVSRWSVIAHSLGTAVIHDTLARLWDPKATKPGGVTFSTSNEQAQLVAMIANVSRVLETPPYDVYQSAVQPGRNAQAGRGCNYYLTARHLYDPFTIPSMFRPQMWPDENALLAKPPRYLYAEVDHIHDWNVHDFGHYLKNPKVHVPLLRRLTDETQISDAEYQHAVARFRTFGPLEDQAAIQIRQKLEGLLPAQSADWMAIGQIWKGFIAKGEAGGLQ